MLLNSLYRLDLDICAFQPQQLCINSFIKDKTPSIRTNIFLRNVRWLSGPKGTLGENPFLKRIIFRFEISCTDLRQNLIIYLYCSEARRATRGQSSAKILRILWLLCKNPIIGLGLERIRLFFSLHKNSLFTEIQSDLNSPLVSKRI